MAEIAQPQTRTRFPAHPRYRWLALLCAGLVALFSWELSQKFDLGFLLFLLVCLALGITNLLQAASYVTLDAASLALHRPLRPVATVEYRQLSGVSEEGRLSRSLVVHYHPLAERPLVDLDSMAGLALPVVVDQDALRATLEGRVPT